MFLLIVNSQIQLQLVKNILHLTAEKGLKVRNIKCDGAAANQSMLNQLACCLDPQDPKPYFAHPALDQRVYACLDICHMLKLSRNAFADGKTFFLADNPNERICCQYIADLSQLQESLGVPFANKLSSQHVNWQKQKMKVKLASQTFSRSVSDALQYLTESGADGFSDCAATIEFIRQVSRLLVILSFYITNTS